MINNPCQYQSCYVGRGLYKPCWEHVIIIFKCKFTKIDFIKCHIYLKSKVN